MKTLNLSSENITSAQFSSIAEKFPNLLDAIIADSGRSLTWTADHIVNFVKKCEHLESLFLKFGENHLNPEYIRNKLPGYKINKISQGKQNTLKIIK